MVTALQNESAREASRVQRKRFRDLAQMMASRVHHSKAYVAFYLVMAVLNTTLVLWIILSKHGHPHSIAFLGLELLITVVLCAEVSIRLIAVGRKFFDSLLNWFDLFVMLFFAGALCFYLAGTSRAEEIDMAISGVLTTLRYAVPIARLLKWIRKKARDATQPEAEGTVDFHQITLQRQASSTRALAELEEDGSEGSDGGEDGAATWAPVFADQDEGEALWHGSVQSALNSVESLRSLNTLSPATEDDAASGSGSASASASASASTLTSSAMRRSSSAGALPSSTSPRGGGSSSRRRRRSSRDDLELGRAPLQHSASLKRAAQVESPEPETPPSTPPDTPPDTPPGTPPRALSPSP